MIHETMVSDIGKQKAQDSDHWERKNEQGRPYDALSHCLEGVQ